MGSPGLTLKPHQGVSYKSKKMSKAPLIIMVITKNKEGRWAFRNMYC